MPSLKKKLPAKVCARCPNRSDQGTFVGDLCTPCVESERWRPCPLEDYAMLYEVSDLARVRRCAPGGAARVGKVLRGCVIDGFPAVTLWKNSKAVTRKVHVLVALAFLRPGEEGEVIVHKDDDRTNARATNLKWSTLSAHAIRRVEVLDKNHGEQVGSHVLTAAEVATIRERLAAGEGVRALGRAYSVCHSTISDIKTGKNWRHD